MVVRPGQSEPQIPDSSQEWPEYFPAASAEA
jgi:hypothetical protein